MQSLIREGNTYFLELGPGGVLAGLMKRIDRTVKVLTIEDVPSLEKAMVELATI
jgi:[acyl-carrier-protein] S-malonyltransferase